MSRVTAALIGCWLSLCLLNSGAGMAVSAQGAHHAQLVQTGKDTKDASTQTGTKKAVQKTVREPAQQVPVEPFDEPAKDEAEKELVRPSGSAAENKQTDPSVTKPKSKTLKKVPEKSAKKPVAMAREEKPEKKTKQTVKPGASAKKAEMSDPGLPIRKPRKPVYRKKKETKTAKKNPPTSRSSRDKKLCKALQKCRNGFIKCKSKIKHPDQSEPWIIAKEVCGGHYKICVEKDFQAGEWFMTRWFYFQELDCGE